ncbi:MAG: hypothetical protein H6P98_3026 [Candidatus Aminicenantes bacterium]|nr:hypothetical protein [Candidatus Aminicenantes bacterium]
MTAGPGNAHVQPFPDIEALPVNHALVIVLDRPVGQGERGFVGQIDQHGAAEAFFLPPGPDIDLRVPTLTGIRVGPLQAEENVLETQLGGPGEIVVPSPFLLRLGVPNVLRRSVGRQHETPVDRQVERRGRPRRDRVILDGLTRRIKDVRVDARVRNDERGLDPERPEVPGRFAQFPLEFQALPGLGFYADGRGSAKIRRR